MDHLLDGLFDLRAGAPHLEAGIRAWLAVDPGCTLAQRRPGAKQGRVDRAQVGVGMRVRAWVATVFAQVIGQCLGGAVPAGRNASPAVPEARARQILPRLADGDAGCMAELDLDACRGGHAHSLPVLDVQALAGVRQLYRYQLRLFVITPGSDERAVDLQGT
ncbi:hypothetical protein D3C80_1304950 [compost metagenome]